jgi:hypothetical protein
VPGFGSNASGLPYATEEAWRRTIEDAGRFLDAWGADAQTMQRTPGELFNMPRDG